MISALLALLPLLALTTASPISKRETGVLIKSGRDGQCLSIAGGRAAVAAASVTDGTSVTTLDCAQASFFDISRGSGSVILTGTNYALDASVPQANFNAAKVWTSYPGSTQQTWYFTDDNRIAITGGSVCLDQGDYTQTYQCTPYNVNQVWTIASNSGSTPSTTSTISATPSATGTVDVAPEIPRRSAIITDTPGNGQRIRPLGRPDLCIGIVGTQQAVLYDCLPDSDSLSQYQRFDIPSGTGQVRLHDPLQNSLCLDAGINPTNGVTAKVYQCGDYPQQQYTFNAAAGTFQTTNNQCLDIIKESTGGAEKPFAYYKSLGFWECSTNSDPYQAFAVLA